MGPGLAATLDDLDSGRALTVDLESAVSNRFGDSISAVDDADDTPDVEELQCCNRTFKSRGGWAGHQRAVHGRKSTRVAPPVARRRDRNGHMQWPKARPGMPAPEESPGWVIEVGTVKVRVADIDDAIAFIHRLSAEKL